LSGAYFRINGLLACEKCTRQLQAQTPKDTHAAYVRGILFGVGGAIAGLILYSAFGIATGIRLGYIALAVGWLVGAAIKKGSNGIGGRRYQIAAVALTYAAVSLSAIPVGIYYILRHLLHPEGKEAGTNFARAQFFASAQLNCARFGALSRRSTRNRPEVHTKSCLNNRCAPLCGPRFSFSRSC
jgi:hypothetical protein